MTIALVYLVILYAALKGFISCNIDNSVQIIIFIESAFIVWPTYVLNVFLRLA